MRGRTEERMGWWQRTQAEEKCWRQREDMVQKAKGKAETSAETTNAAEQPTTGK